MGNLSKGPRPVPQWIGHGPGQSQTTVPAAKEDRQ